MTDNNIHNAVVAILAKPMTRRNEKTGEPAKYSPAINALAETQIELQQADLIVLAAYAVHDILTGVNAKNFRKYLTEQTIFARMFGTHAEAVSSPDFQDSESLFKALVSKAPIDKLLTIARNLDGAGNLDMLLLPDQVKRIEAARESEKAFQESLDFLHGLTPGLEWRVQNAHKKVFYANTDDKRLAHVSLQGLKEYFKEENPGSIRLSELTANDSRGFGMAITKEKSTDEFGDKVETFKSASFYCRLNDIDHSNES